MDKTALLSRISDLGKAVEQSLSNHNALLGRLAEAQYMLQLLEKFEADCKSGNIPGAFGDIADGIEELEHPGGDNPH